MGKIRVKTLGDEDLEKKQKQEAKNKQEQKKSRLQSPARSNGGQVAKVHDEEKIEPKEEVKTEATEKKEEPVKTLDKKKSKKEKFTTSKKQARSRKYQTVAKLVDKNKIYSLRDALELLPQLKISGFDETVELHMNTIEPGISGNLSLPHGTGKKTRVVIASDELIAQVEKGGIDFDVLLASPQMMPKLAKVARILGPKGLMPNPKNGTISPKPEDLIKKYEQGQISFKTEAKTPIIHLSVGKLSFGNKKLEENIKAVFSSVSSSKVKKAVLKSTMSPGIKIDFSSI